MFWKKKFSFMSVLILLYYSIIIVFSNFHQWKLQIKLLLTNTKKFFSIEKLSNRILKQLRKNWQTRKFKLSQSICMQNTSVQQFSLGIFFFKLANWNRDNTRFTANCHFQKKNIFLIAISLFFSKKYSIYERFHFSSIPFNFFIFFFLLWVTDSQGICQLQKN